MKFLLVVMFVLVMMFSWCHGQDLDGSYDSNGVWMPKDKTISQTYKLPDLSTGFLVSKKTIYSVLGIELYDRKAKAIDFLVEKVRPYIEMAVEKRMGGKKKPSKKK